VALVPPIDLAQFDLTVDPYRFSTDFAPDLAQLDPITTELDGLATAQSSYDPSPTLQAADSAFNEMSAAVGSFPIDTGQTDLANVDKASGQTDGNITAAQLAIGAGITKATGIGISIPTLTGITVSKPSAPSAPPPVLPGVGSSQPGTANKNFTLQFIDLNQPGGGFTHNVGHAFQITVTGAPGVRIFVTANHNGVSHGQAGFGTIAANGKLVVTGQWSAADVGEWNEDWYAEKSFIGHLDFAVR
jgi:hypothetical protein